MDSLTDATDILRNDERVVQKSLIGGAILILSVFTVPAFFYQGYLMRILKETESGEMTELPEWENWKQLLIDGGLAAAFNFALLIPLYLFILIPIFIGEPLYILASILPITVLSYFSPAMLTLFIRDGVNEAFNWTRLKAITFSKQYVLALCIITIASIGVTIVSFGYIVFTYFMGIFAYPFLLVPVNCVFMYLLGQAVTETDPKLTERDSDSE